MKLCSACLLGVKCRYDGQNNLNKKIVELSKKEALLPVCPEQLGGLPTPREVSEIQNSRVTTKSGQNMTNQFRDGAKEVLKLAKRLGITEAILKQRSPSCGSGTVYDGTFSRTRVYGDGITTQLLKKNGIKVLSEEEV
jgi:uncharacterized protein YbbK (DUF523 family)